MEKTKGDTRIKGAIPSLKSFEETYKTAYTHGLEMIYSLENVDFKTVRRIEENAPKEEEKEAAAQELTHVNLADKDPQLELDLGEGFRDWIEPYFLQEPIHVLGLSLQAESCLLEHGLKTLSELLAHNFRDYVFMKGMGQGHIDEVKKKLEKYIGGRSVKKTFTIDFQSLILSLSHGINFKRLSQYLMKYNLGSEIPLTPSEKIEIKAFEHSKDMSWQREVQAQLSQEATKMQLLQQLERVAKAFIIPWVDARGGIATEEEIIERIERVAGSKEKTESYLAFLKDHFTEGKFPFSPFLPEAEKGVFCSSVLRKNQFLEIIQRGIGYFYNPSVVFPLEELTTYLIREFCKEWTVCSSETIFHCFSLSREFEMYRGATGQRLIRLS